MAFINVLGGGRSPPIARGGRQSMANGGTGSRDKVSRIGILSVILFLYSGMTVAMILWNQSASPAASQSLSGAGSGAGSGAANSQDNANAPGVGDGLARPTTQDKRRQRDPESAGLDERWNRREDGDTSRAPPPPPGQAAGGPDGSWANGDPNQDKRSGVIVPAQADRPGPPGGELGSKPGNGDRFGEGAGSVPTSPPMEEHFDVTLVSQTSRNRFWMLPFLCKRWPGPISIAILEEDREELPQDLCSRMVISVTRTQTVEELDPVWYPVNRLRNVAVRAVETSHFLMTDIDIWPDVNAYQALHMRYRLETERLEDARNAIVFSAFSRRRFCDGDCLLYANDVPETITELKPCLESNTCGRFDAANPFGQGTAYVYYWRSMLRQPTQRTLEHILCFKSHRFEPYLVVRKSSILPAFDERFSGYGKNKIQWINHLRYSGFSFYVMPVNFVIHAPHPKSEAKTVWEKTGGGKQGKGNKIMDQMFETFMAELRAEKGGEENTVTGLCQKDKPTNKHVSQFAHRNALDVPKGGKAASARS